MKKNKDIVSIDVNNDELRLVHIRITGAKKEIGHVMAYATKGLSCDEIAENIKKTIKEFGIRNPQVINIVPLNLAITKNLEVPSLDPQEVKEIIDLQSGRQTPYARDEIIVDYFNIGTYRQNYTKILLVIVTREAIKRLFEIITKADLHVENIYFSPEALAHESVKKIESALHNSPVGIIHVDANFTDFIITLRGMPIFTRSIPIGTSHFFVKKEQTALDFPAEIKKSLETYHAEDIEVSANMLLLCGAIDELKELESLIKTVTNIPLKRAAYLNDIPFTKGTTAPVTVRNISFFSHIAAISSLRSFKVNLIPEELKLKRSFEDRAHLVVRMGIYIICLFILIGGIFISKLYFKSVYREKLNTEYEVMNKEAEILEKAMERIRIVKHYLKNRGFSLHVLSMLFDVLPDSIMLTDIKLDIQGNLYLKGTARAMSDVFSFVVSLKESDYFSNVETNYTTSRKEKGEDWADFGIACILKKSQ